MLLTEKTINLPANNLTKSSSFIIERVNIPEAVNHLTLSVRTACPGLNLILIYDSNYNLRAEVMNIPTKKEIHIHEEEALTSQGAKAGRIPVGEWIIAFEAKVGEREEAVDCRYSVEVEA